MRVRAGQSWSGHLTSELGGSMNLLINRMLVHQRHDSSLLPALLSVTTATAIAAGSEVEKRLDAELSRCDL